MKSLPGRAAVETSELVRGMTRPGTLAEDRDFLPRSEVRGPRSLQFSCCLAWRTGEALMVGFPRKIGITTVGILLEPSHRQEVADDEQGTMAVHVCTRRDGWRGASLRVRRRHLPR